MIWSGNAPQRSWKCHLWCSRCPSSFIPPSRRRRITHRKPSYASWCIGKGTVCYEPPIRKVSNRHPRDTSSSLNFRNWLHPKRPENTRHLRISGQLRRWKELFSFKKIPAPFRGCEARPDTATEGTQTQTGSRKEGSTFMPRSEDQDL